MTRSRYIDQFLLKPCFHRALGSSSQLEFSWTCTKKVDLQYRKRHCVFFPSHYPQVTLEQLELELDQLRKFYSAKEKWTSPMEEAKTAKRERDRNQEWMDRVGYWVVLVKYGYSLLFFASDSSHCTNTVYAIGSTNSNTTGSFWVALCLAQAMIFYST